MTKPYFRRFSDRLAVAIAFIVFSILIYGALQAFSWFAKPMLPYPPEYAVVRLPSHGASATVVYTDESATWLLTAAHSFRNTAAADRPIQIDFCNERVPAEASKAKATIVLCTDGLDLCLLKLDYGPVPFTAPVAPDLHSIGRCVSCGYDGMRRPVGNGPFVSAATGNKWGNGYTSVKATGAPGRSGGGIIETDTGFLVGVIQGGTAERTNFTSHRAIVLFLKAQNYGWLLAESRPLTTIPRSDPESNPTSARRFWPGIYWDLSEANPLIWVICIAPFVISLSVFLFILHSIQANRDRLQSVAAARKHKKPQL